MQYSILMSVYRNDKPEYLDASIQSMLMQTVLTNDFVIIIDGPINKELYDVIKKYKNTYPAIINIIELEKNMGLGYALMKGVNVCKNELVARMDADDISYKNRIKIQLKKMNELKDIDVLGSYVEEFIDNPKDIVSVREVPLIDRDIKSKMRRGNPLNHSSVVFKKSKVIKAGNYKNIRTNQDIELWNRMKYDNCTFLNIPRSLVKFRLNNDTIRRRKDINNNILMVRIWCSFYRKKYCGFVDLLYISVVSFLNIILPVSILQILYKISRKR